MSTCNKSQKVDHAEQDLISSLPYRVISHILSCLPIRDAVRTSLLSKDWEYKWTYRHDSAIDDGIIFKNEGRKKANFINFVERTLLLTPILQSFTLSCRGDYDLQRWITAALCRNVHHLKLDCSVGENFALPRNLFTSHSLKELVLIIPFTFKLPTKAFFHNLTTLVLNHVRILNEHSTSDRVEFSFPLMEKLEIGLCKWLNIKFVEIDAPKMTDLSLWDATNGLNNCSFKIIGDSPMKFTCYEQSDQINVDVSESAVVYAILERDFEGDDPLLAKSGLRFRKLLIEVSSLKVLELWGGLAEAIAQSKLGPSLPKYNNMEHLALRRPLGNPEALLELLHAAPYLKLLDIDVTAGLEDYDYDAEEFVPSCLVSHLEKLRLFSYTGAISQEIELVKFLLKNAERLKSLRVHLPLNPSPMREEERHEMAEELRTYPKASACLTISVEGAYQEKLNDDVPWHN